MSLRQMLADDTRKNIEDNPTQFTFDGNLYIGDYSGLAKSQRLEVGGYDVEPVAAITINLLTAFGNPTFEVERPQPDDIITVDGKTLRVRRVSVDAQESTLVMDLATDSR